MVTPFFRTGNLQNGTYEILYILISIDCFRETIPAHNSVFVSTSFPGPPGSQGRGRGNEFVFVWETHGFSNMS